MPDKLTPHNTVPTIRRFGRLTTILFSFRDGEDARTNRDMMREALS
jgi:hypothetical protein